MSPEEAEETTLPKPRSSCAAFSSDSNHFLSRPINGEKAIDSGGESIKRRLRVLIQAATVADPVNSIPCPAAKHQGSPHMSAPAMTFRAPPCMASPRLHCCASPYSRLTQPHRTIPAMRRHVVPSPTETILAALRLASPAALHPAAPRRALPFLDHTCHASLYRTTPGPAGPDHSVPRLLFHSQPRLASPRRAVSRHSIPCLHCYAGIDSPSIALNTPVSSFRMAYLR